MIIGPQTSDEEWIGEIGRRRWVAVTRGARIRYSPLALRVLMERGTKLLLLVGKLTSAEAAQMFLKKMAGGNRVYRAQRTPSVHCKDSARRRPYLASPIRLAQEPELNSSPAT
jgi:PIN domain-containing protein